MLDNIGEQLFLINQKLDDISKLLRDSNNVLKTKKQVATYLSVSTRTISNYLHNGTFIKDYHFSRDDRGKIIFITDAIISFKTNGVKKMKKGVQVRNRDVKTKTFHPSVEAITRGVL